MKKVTTVVIAAAFVAAAFAQTPAQPASGGSSTTAAAVQLVNVVSDPKWGATVPVGQALTVNFRAQLSDGTTVSDFRTLPLVFSVSTSDGARLGSDLLQCKPEIGQCTVGSDKPRVVYMSVSLPSGGLGYAGLNICFFRQPTSVTTPMIDISSSQGQANDSTSPVLVMTSPLTSPGPVTLIFNSQYTSDVLNKTMYLQDGISFGQRVVLNTEDVRPLSFRDRRNFSVTMTGPSGNVIAQGFGSSVGTIETRQIDAKIDENGDLVFTLQGGFDASVDYTISILRGNLFRVELSQARNELYAYAYGDKTRLVFNKGSLAGNRFDLPAGMYTVSMNARDRSTGIGWSHSQADVLSADYGLTLQ